jgi:hypothetical protein
MGLLPKEYIWLWYFIVMSKSPKNPLFKSTWTECRFAASNCTLSICHSVLGGPKFHVHTLKFLAAAAHNWHMICDQQSLMGKPVA